MPRITYGQARDLLKDSPAGYHIDADFIDELKPDEIASMLARVFGYNVTVDTKNNLLEYTPIEGDKECPI